MPSGKEEATGWRTNPRTVVVAAAAVLALEW
jgi:preprotein translocase subunit Sec61beta